MKKGRRKKVRYVQRMPKVSQFSPRGKAGRPDEVELRIDHYEAIKLADYQGYNQAESAAIMGISRASFGRIVREARHILADCIVNAKSLRIRISDVQVGVRQSAIPNKRELLKQTSLSDPHLDIHSKKNEEQFRKAILKYTQKVKKSK